MDYTLATKSQQTCSTPAAYFEIKQMAHPNGSSDTLEKHQYEVCATSCYHPRLSLTLRTQVCNAFARAAVAMRDAAQTAENFSNWFSRVNNLQNVPAPPMFNGLYNFSPTFGGQQQQQPYQSSEVEQTGKKRKTSGDQEGKRKRQVKEKKPKDLNAPKRPPSAYLLFQNEVRKNFKGEHPDMPYSQVLSEISKLWHALTPEEKAVCALARCPLSSLNGILCSRTCRRPQTRKSYTTKPKPITMLIAQ